MLGGVTGRCSRVSTSPTPPPCINLLGESGVGQSDPFLGVPDLALWRLEVQCRDDLVGCFFPIGPGPQLICHEPGISSIPSCIQYQPCDVGSP